MNRNLFAEIGIDPKKIEKRLEEIFQNMFYGPENERIYFPVGDDMAYMMDTGNIDARTEGMSYGMMMCVQLDKKEEFDRLWKWSMTYMYMDYGWNKGYFAWSCKPDGTKNAQGAAPDGEEYFAAALFLAERRWGNGEGIFNYGQWGRKILSDCLHKGEPGREGAPMWDPENKMILFVVSCGYTDPSYHLPHFYELFAECANEEDRPFWKEAARVSREYLQKACHPVTGMSAEYANFDGTPKILDYNGKKNHGGRHDWFFSDAYRTIANISLDAEWFGGRYGEAVDENDGQMKYFPRRTAEHMQKFFCETRNGERGIYLIDGTLVEPQAKHYLAITATLAQSALASGPEAPFARRCVQEFWEAPLRSDKYRYYDNCLYMFAFLALSGHYKLNWEAQND